MSLKKTALSWLTLGIITTMLITACSPSPAPTATIAISTETPVPPTDTPVPPADTIAAPTLPESTALIPNTGTTGGVATMSAPDISVSTNSTLGQILTDSKGMTLYAFTNDKADTSNCTDTCATNWPPLTVAQGITPTAASGATVTLGTLTRADGTIQVSVNHMPVYYFSGDIKPGDTNGQGIGSAWFVLDAAGSLVQPATSASTPAPTSAPAASAPSVLLAPNTSLGTVLTDDKGRTLYAFAKDTPGVSNCTTGACASNWPAFQVSQGVTPMAGSGVMATVGTFTRPDGVIQVTVNGLPVYYFASDAQPGDAGGQGIGGVWFVLGVDGNMVKSTATTMVASPTPGY